MPCARRFAAQITRLRTDDRGASAVEFALVSLPLLALLLFIVQAFMVYLGDAALDTFAESTARNLMTGNTQKTSLNATTFQTAVCATLPSAFSCSRLWVDVQNVSAYSSANLGSPSVAVDASGNVTTAWNYNPGAQGAIVVIRMAYMWPVVSMPIGSLATIGSTIHQLTAASVLKTEIYQ